MADPAALVGSLWIHQALIRGAIFWGSLQVHFRRKESQVVVSRPPTIRSAGFRFIILTCGKPEGIPQFVGADLFETGKRPRAITGGKGLEVDAEDEHLIAIDDARIVFVNDSKRWHSIQE